MTVIIGDNGLFSKWSLGRELTFPCTALALLRLYVIICVQWDTWYANINGTPLIQCSFHSVITHDSE